jgi:organic radical activating enzyme
MELNVRSLVIEATRKCNMNCEHCLRGNSQRKTADNNHIYKLFQLISNVSDLTITGGEPTLAMDTLEYIEQAIRYGYCDVSSFYIVTNGKSINVERLAKWAYDMRDVCYDNEMSSVNFSFDDFHLHTFNNKQLEKQRRNCYKLQEILDEEYGIYEEENFVSKHSNSDWGYSSLLKEGRAKDFGSRDNNVQFFEEYETETSIDFSETELYLTCSGYLIAGCNWSYHSMDSRKDIQIAHIDDIRCQDDLIEAIKTYNKKHQEVLECV